jgi:hypothetical protein
METIKRKDFKGFTIKAFNHCTEFVFYKYKLITIAIYEKNNRILTKRFNILKV